MNLPFFDVGISPAQVAQSLAQNPVLSIAGFQGSGKSTLAEKLHREMNAYYRSVEMQDASTWLLPRTAAASGHPRIESSIDAEIVAVLDRVEREGAAFCWIVDNAEVVLAYATDEMLRALGRHLRVPRFSLVLIRNRFILEGEGWFPHRLSLISAAVPTLAMRPLREDDAIEFATGIVRNRWPAAEPWISLERGRWLARMSGGIPGLIELLQPYAPQQPYEELPPRLTLMVQRKRQELDLEKMPVRAMLIAALGSQVLPPTPFLSEDARRELGVLALTGMVSPEYASGERAFRGGFWERVSRHDSGPSLPGAALPERHVDAALQLAAIFGSATLLELFGSAAWMAGDPDIAFARAFAQALTCRERYADLVRPLDEFIAGTVGRLGLLRILMTRGDEPDLAASPAELAAHMLRHAGA